MDNKNYLPKFSLGFARKLILLVILLAVVFAGGYFVGIRGYTLDKLTLSEVVIDRSIPQDKKEVNLNLFWKVWDSLEKDYIDKSKLIANDLVYGAIRGMVAAVGDPYTAFLSPDENKTVQEDLQGTFQGVGIQIGFRGTQLAVIAPLPGSPAEKAGIKAGDYIIGISDEAKGIDMGTVGISLPEAVQAIRGPQGSKITLTLLRNGSDEPLILEITREEINVPSVTLSFVGEGENIAHMRLLKFAGETDGEFDKVVADILKKSPKGIVIDLRNNPGGYLQGSVDIAGEFLSTGTLVVIEESSNRVREEFKTDKMPRLSKFPIVVLVNKGSASASEILAGALREQVGTKLVGETTFGKGTIQEPRQLEGGSSLHITTAKWLTPKGNWVNDKGLEPDVKIEDNSETEEDEQLLEAIKVFQ